MSWSRKARRIMMLAVIIAAVMALATGYHIVKASSYKATIREQQYEINRLEKELTNLQNIFLYKERME